MSHWPPPPSFIRLTISSDDPAGCRLSLQPVAAVNGSAHDLSAYPSHRTRLSWPSPAPMEVWGFMFAVGGGDDVLPVGVPVEPHAVRTTAAAAANAPNFIALPLPPVVRERMSDRASRPAVQAGLRTSGRRPKRPYSDVPPRVAPHGRGAPGSACSRRCR